MEIKTIGQLIEHLAKKAGIDSADPNLINILSNAELSKVAVHSDLASGIDNALLSLSQATDNHPAIKSKYHAQAMNAFDARMAAVMNEAGLSEETIEALNAEKSTYKRFEQFTAAMKEAAAKSAAAPANTEDKSALQKQVDDLLAANKQAKKEAEERVTAIEQERRNDRIRFELKGMLAPIKTVFDDLPPSAKSAAIDSIINKALQDKGASFDFDDADTFILKGKDDTAVVGANSSKYTPQSFVDEILAQNKVLKVTETVTPPSQANGSTQQRVTTVDAGTMALTGNNQTTAQNNRRNREAFEKATSQA